MIFKAERENVIAVTKNGASEEAPFFYVIGAPETMKLDTGFLELVSSVDFI